VVGGKETRGIFQWTKKWRHGFEREKIVNREVCKIQRSESSLVGKQ